MRSIARTFGAHRRLFTSRPALSLSRLQRLAVQHSSTMSSSSFTQAVVQSMRNLYPESLADKSFDNTGLLLESPSNSSTKNTALLTIDLTRAVANEAIENNHSIVIAYHPIIFRGLKSLTLSDPQQQTLLRLAAAGISVYSPHTAVDTVPGGMADWLCDIVTGKVEPEQHPAVTANGAKETSSDHVRPSSQEKQPSAPASETDVTTSEDGDVFTKRKSRPGNIRTYSKPSYPSRHRGSELSEATLSPIQSTPETVFHPSSISHSRSVITPSPSSAINAANKAHREIVRTAKSASSDNSDNEAQQAKTNEDVSQEEPCPYTSANTGAGRLITFDEPQPLAALITRIAHATGTPKGFPVAIPQGAALENLQVKTVGICPGSGGSVIRGLDAVPDLVFTGELSHHEALSVVERGGCVITLFHSNSERGYLDAVMREKLEEEVERISGEEREEVRVHVSSVDRDPYGIVVLQESSVKGQQVG